jgi:hypothetical protein
MASFGFTAEVDVLQPTLALQTAERARDRIVAGAETVKQAREKEKDMTVNIKIPPKPGVSQASFGSVREVLQQLLDQAVKKALTTPNPIPGSSAYRYLITRSRFLHPKLTFYLLAGRWKRSAPVCRAV